MNPLSRVLGAGTAGLAAGVAGGALAGLADCLRGVLGLGEAVPAGRWLAADAWYAIAFGAAGLVLGAVAGLAAGDARRRAVHVVLAFVLGTMTTLLVKVRFGGLPLVALPAVLAVVFGAVLFMLRRGFVPRPRLAHALILIGVVLVVSVTVDLAGSPRNGEVPVLQETERMHPAVLLVVVDTLRADHMSLYGYARDTTPNLDRFSERGLVFEQAHAPSPWTKPSVPSLLTGLPPSVHGVEEWSDLLPMSATTLAEELNVAGYRTALFSDNIFLSTRFRHEQGFERVADLVGGPEGERRRLPAQTLLGQVVASIADKHDLIVNPNYRQEKHTAPGINRLFLEWLDTEGDRRPWFAYLHYIEPHEPYTPPEPWDRKYPRAADGAERFYESAGHAPFEAGSVLTEEQATSFVDAYDAEIAFWDHCFGELLAELEERGELESTVVVVTSDHGESFYEHGTWSHRNSLYAEQIRVPLVVRGPGVPAGRTDRHVTNEGVRTTIVGLAGFVYPEQQPFPPAAPSFVPVPAGDMLCRARLLHLGAEQTSLIHDGRKWILSVRDGEEILECYDLAGDPGEERDLSKELASEGRRMRARIRELERVDAMMALDGGKVSLSRDLEDQLRGMGYLR